MFDDINKQDPLVEVPYSADQKEHRKQHVTDPVEVIDAAYAQYEMPVVQIALRKMLNWAISLGDPHFSTVDALSYVDRFVRNWCYDNGVERIVIGATYTVLKRLFAADHEEFREYARLSGSKYDAYLYQREPERFSWLMERLHPSAYTDAIQFLA